MIMIALEFGDKPSYVEVDDFSALPDGPNAVCLKRCEALRLYKNDSCLGAESLVLASAGAFIPGSNGVVCWSYDSCEIFSEITPEDWEVEALVLDLDGVLDEELNIGTDFSVIGACVIRKLEGLDRMFLASGSVHANAWWCYQIRVAHEAARVLLTSATEGYLLGLRFTDPRSGETVRLVRHAGYDDGSTDLLHWRELPWSGSADVRRF